MSEKKNGKNKKIRHLGWKVSLVSACLLIFSIAAITQLCVYMIRTMTMNILEKQCVSGTNVLMHQLENEYGTDDLNMMLDELKEETGCEYTIFNGDERAYTTIIQDGERAVGTKLSDNLVKIVLEEGQSYIGEAEILGVDHLCSYVPTTDDSGEVNGLIFAGISMADVSQQINRTIQMASLSGIFLIVVSLVVLAFFMRHTVLRPLSKLTSLAQTMEKGDLGLKNRKSSSEVHIDSNDEIGFLAHTFENTMNRLNEYIGELSEVLKSTAQGNLTVEPQKEYIGDFSSIKDSLEDILGKLNDTMARIVESADYVSGGAEQMAMAATALSQGSVEQASSLEDLNGNVQDISEQVENTADTAAQAKLKVEDLGGHLAKSNQKMQEMTDAMQEISESSNEIRNIIKTIETISFQTNILALNASVEAARAGEAGKGFAVVAEEVRELAVKSADASKTTTELIERSISAVEQGTRIADETAEQLAAVVAGADEIVDATNKIADAARTEADYIFQIREQVSQISDVVQTNSATAEQTAATSQELSQQAGILKGLTQMFRLK